MFTRKLESGLIVVHAKSVPITLYTLSVVDSVWIWAMERGGGAKEVLCFPKMNLAGKLEGDGDAIDSVAVVVLADTNELVISASP